MANAPPQIADSSGVGDIGPLRESFLRHLAAENKSPNTLLTYGKAIDHLAAFLSADQSVEDIGREDIEAFLLRLQSDGWKPSSVANRYRSLQ